MAMQYMENHAQEVSVARMNWQQVQERLAAGAVALLPIGAACKEHGLHLPMNTDFVQVEWFARQLAKDKDIIIWPVLAYGYYPAFVEYAGSISLCRETFINSVCDILGGIKKAGAQSIIVLNAGISTIEPLEEAIGLTDSNNHVRLMNLYAGEHYKRAITDCQQQVHGSNADEIETSIMLMIACELVNMDKAVCCDTEMQAGVFNPHSPAQANYSASGVYGDATLATTDKGSSVVQAMLDDLRNGLQ